MSSSGEFFYTLGRSTKDLLSIIDTLTEKGVTLISHKENIDTDTSAGKFMLTVFAASLSWSVNSSNSDSVKQAASKERAQLIAYAEQRALRLLMLRVSTQEESPLRSTGRNSVSFMGNGSPRVSQGVTLCGEWACQLTLSIAVSGNMNQLTALPSRPLLDHYF